MKAHEWLDAPVSPPPSQGWLLRCAVVQNSKLLKRDRDMDVMYDLSRTTMRLATLGTTATKPL